jgi:DNA helicase-2/ATP-dependent DNA helicase PcrA
MEQIRPTASPSIEQRLVERLTSDQQAAVRSAAHRLLIVAGAGSGKTEVMARRIAWWVGVESVQREKIIAFTFTEHAAEEMKFRIRSWIERVTPVGQEVSLGQMYVGTIHGFCLLKLREIWPDSYHNFDILDEAARTALLLRGYNDLLGLKALQDAWPGTNFPRSRADTIDGFSQAYDQLQEHNAFSVRLPDGEAPYELGQIERDWCKRAVLETETGQEEHSKAFAIGAARYYAYLRCRRFIDFSTSQSELVRRLKDDPNNRSQIESLGMHLVVDEVQDINPIQKELIDLLTSSTGRLTMVGDHRQSIYGFRGARVEILADYWKQFKKRTDAAVIDLTHNFRSTPRIVDLANRWAATINELGSMETRPMVHGNERRKDQHRSHIAVVHFEEREHEAEWIAEAVKVLVPSSVEGARHDTRRQSERGIALSDIAVLVRSSTDVRTYMRALEAAQIPCITRAGPDLFSQPEVLLIVAALAISAKIEQFFGAAHNAKSLPGRIAVVLACDPEPQKVFRAAAKSVRQSGLSFKPETEERLLKAAQSLAKRVVDAEPLSRAGAQVLRTPELRDFLSSKNQLRRVFPQKLYHLLLSEAEVDQWDRDRTRGQAALFHLGALSGLITGIETPGWTSAQNYRWQIIGLCQYGSETGRVAEQPLMVQPDAVTITTIHAVKGLEFAAVFLADVKPQRFPSNFSRRLPDLPLDGEILAKIDVESLRDNENYDSERRLMYVALTRCERFLFVSYSGSKQSRFIRDLAPIVQESGGLVTEDPAALLEELRYAPKEHLKDNRFMTSFSELRYYLECPHDFYFRKVLGFAPTIDQAFGYGRGVHNLLRAIHSDPTNWARLADNKVLLRSELRRLIDRGLFYLRYTTGEPAENMRNKGVEVVANYIQRYRDELANLTFEPEKAFETLVKYEDEEGGALISGAIDIVRRDNPPRVTLIDFKSGDPESDKHRMLAEHEMKLQVALYAVAAKKELEYEPEQGLVRYLDAANHEKSEMQVPLDAASIEEARSLVAGTAARIRDRKFHIGPKLDKQTVPRCKDCDFLCMCGLDPAMNAKRAWA